MINSQAPVNEPVPHQVSHDTQVVASPINAIESSMVLIRYHCNKAANDGFH